MQLREFRDLLNARLGNYSFTVIDRPVMNTFIAHLDSKGLTQRKLAMARYCCSFITGLISLSDYNKCHDWVILSEAQIGDFCMMSKEEVNSARSICVEMGIIEVARKGTSKRFAYQYKVNVPEFMALIVKNNDAEQGLTDESTGAEPALNIPLTGAEPPSTGAEHTVTGAEPALINIYNNKQDINKQVLNNKLFNDAAACVGKQKTLFSMPKVEEEKKLEYSGNKLMAIMAIQNAMKHNVWTHVTNTHLAYYYIIMHEKILGREMPHEKIKVGVNTKSFKENFLDLYPNLPRESIVKCIDEILTDYAENGQKDPAYKDLLTFRALGTVWKVQCGRIVSRYDEKSKTSFFDEMAIRAQKARERAEILEDRNNNSNIF